MSEWEHARFREQGTASGRDSVDRVFTGSHRIIKRFLWACPCDADNQRTPATFRKVLPGNSIVRSGGVVAIWIAAFGLVGLLIGFGGIRKVARGIRIAHKSQKDEKPGRNDESGEPSVPWKRLWKQDHDPRDQ